MIAEVFTSLELGVWMLVVWIQFIILAVCLGISFKDMSRQINDAKAEILKAIEEKKK